MKLLKLTIILLLGIILGIAFTTYASYVKLIQVPEYIKGYSTIELLEYLANLKANQDALDKIPKPTIQKQPKGVKGIMSADLILEYAN